MRISDWSSDVCSSDLRISVACSRRHRHLAAPICDEGAARPRAADARPDRPQPCGAVRGDGLYQPEPFQPRFQELVRHGAERLSPAGTARATLNGEWEDRKSVV